MCGRNFIGHKPAEKFKRGKKRYQLCEDCKRDLTELLDNHKRLLTRGVRPDPAFDKATGKIESLLASLPPFFPHGKEESSQVEEPASSQA